MFGKSKPSQANVLSHWYTPVPSFNMSTQEFYKKVEAELKTQQVPGLTISRPEFSEAGLFSAKRQYLRLKRDDVLFDICAAPFGVNYFFSCRFAATPPTGLKAMINMLLNLILEKLNLRLTDTYHQEDTRLMYMTVVESIVKKLVEQETAAQGVKLLSQYEYAPILSDRYRSKTKVLEPDQAEVIAE